MRRNFLLVTSIISAICLSSFLLAIDYPYADDPNAMYYTRKNDGAKKRGELSPHEKLLERAYHGTSYSACKSEDLEDNASDDNLSATPLVLQIPKIDFSHLAKGLNAQCGLIFHGKTYELGESGTEITLPAGDNLNGAALLQLSVQRLSNKKKIFTQKIKLASLNQEKTIRITYDGVLADISKKDKKGSKHRQEHEYNYQKITQNSKYKLCQQGKQVEYKQCHYKKENKKNDKFDQCYVTKKHPISFSFDVW